jgi:pimeloyl-ACP methyl ester carboxylesterase
MLTEHPFDTGSVTLNVAEGPANGPPLVLLHGGSGRWQSWEAIVPELMSRWQLFAPDLRGHGQSGRAPGRYTLRDYAGDILALLRERVREPTVIFGHSLGGIIALMVAAQEPALVRAVLVGDSPLTATTWQALLEHDHAGLEAWRDLSGGRHAHEEIIEALKNAPAFSTPDKPHKARMREVWGEDSPVFGWVATNLYLQDASVLSALIDDFAHTAAGYDMDQLLPRIGCPVLLLQADPASGGIMTDAEVAHALTLLRQPSHTRLAGVSHVLHNEQKEAVLAALQPFLDSI